MKRANGTGSIIKLKGNRRRPYAVRITTGFNDKGYPIYKYVSYHAKLSEAQQAIAEYTNDPYSVSKKTLEDLFEEWLPLQIESKAPGTIRQYKGAWNHLKPLHKERLQNIDRLKLQEFFDSVKLSRSPILNIEKLLGVMFKYAVKRGILPISALNLLKVVDKTPKVQERSHGRGIYSKEQLAQMWEKKDDPHIRITLFYIYTGMRWSELHDLSPENIHFDESYIDITHAKTRAGVRIVPLSDKAKSLFPLPSIPSYNFYNEDIKARLGHTTHDARHTFITMLAEAGIDERVIQTIVGHKRSGVTGIYTHIGLETMLEAVNKL